MKAVIVTAQGSQLARCTRTPPAAGGRRDGWTTPRTRAWGSTASTSVNPTDTLLPTPPPSSISPPLPDHVTMWSNPGPTRAAPAASRFSPDEMCPCSPAAKLVLREVEHVIRFAAGGAARQTSATEDAI